MQGLLQKGLVVVVGSGASCAYGLPGMGDLATYVLEQVPSRLSAMTTPPREGEWAAIAARLTSGAGLESALAVGLETRELGDLIAQVVGDRVASFEQDAIASILAVPTTSALGRLFGHVLRVTGTLDVITTNYDRLIEVHAAKAGIPVDSMFYGHTLGRLDHQRSRAELWEIQSAPGKARTSSRPVVRPHLSLSKPHGSLDWFTHHGVHYRTDLPVPGARRIIAPGGDKYRLGYELPFDSQRERANRAIDQATALVFIGYGFNDEHLQTHLKTRFAHVPSVLLSRSLTPSALGYLDQNPQAMGIEAGEAGGCTVRRGDGLLRTEDNLWDIDVSAKEVFGI
jgi:hypothetical protein